MLPGLKNNEIFKLIRKKIITVNNKKADQTYSPKKNDDGSIMVIIATDIPLTSRQLHRLAKRAPLGIARTGGYASNGSGDFVISFSTKIPCKSKVGSNFVNHTKLIEASSEFNLLLKAVVDSTEEAILNALLMSHTMIGRDDHTSYALSENESFLQFLSEIAK